MGFPDCCASCRADEKREELTAFQMIEIASDALLDRDRPKHDIQ